MEPPEYTEKLSGCRVIDTIRKASPASTRSSTAEHIRCVGFAPDDIVARIGRDNKRLRRLPNRKFRLRRCSDAREGMSAWQQLNKVMRNASFVQVSILTGAPDDDDS
ncbi:hypothetical protein EYF80_055309 [Liparis tanakae]|uniref:Uncharacterized protein n=1 Tax=Liparis tanakae TaxID=230148 RepID=A0A4Z2EZY2_9TELE|nr:hypothetical protein EYF80_055309 [Liparis tanakae]